jgi:hypothetical protein
VSTLIDVTCDADLVACAGNTVLHDVSGEWIVFLDHGVELEQRWIGTLGRDLARASSRPSVACSGGSPSGRALDVAYRRSSIDELGPFGECSDVWSTDLDMQLRLTAAGFAVEAGSRHSV